MIKRNTVALLILVPLALYLAVAFGAALALHPQDPGLVTLEEAQNWEAPYTIDTAAMSVCGEPRSCPYCGHEIDDCSGHLINIEMMDGGDLYQFCADSLADVLDAHRVGAWVDPDD